MPMELRAHIQSVLPMGCFAALFVGPHHEGGKGGHIGWEDGALAWGIVWPLRALGGQGPPAFKKGACNLP